MMQMTLWPEENVVYVNPEVIEKLGMPRHVQLRINDSQKMVVLRACNANEKHSIIIPSIPMIQFEVSGRKLLEHITVMMGWNDNRPRVIEGVYVPAKDLIAFDLENAELAELENEEVSYGQS